MSLKLRQCFVVTSGRLHRSAKMYGEVFVNGAKSHMSYGSYVSSTKPQLLLDLHLFFCIHFFFFPGNLHLSMCPISSS